MKHQPTLTKFTLFAALAMMPLSIMSQNLAMQPTDSSDAAKSETISTKKSGIKKKKERKEYSEMIADDSYLIENAINIEPGTLHTITSCTSFRSPTKDMACGITQETSFNGGRQVISYSLPYSFLDSNSIRGNGDVAITFRHQLTTEKDWAVVSPRFTAFLPTGDHSKGMGSGSAGFQFNLPVTKRLSEYFLATFNSGFTFVPRAMGEDADGQTVRRSLVSYNLGGSLVWRAHRNFHPMIEYAENFGSEINELGNVSRYNEHVVSPGIGLAWKFKYLRVSPGFAVPISFRDGEFRTGYLFYFAFEHVLRKHKHVVIAADDRGDK